MSRPQSDRAAEYRRQAQQIRDVAAWISRHDVRKQLLETVCHLEVLALEEERRHQPGRDSERQPAS
ncbi:MAG TPA: hypothetical protein VHL98_18755 [Microvirga sp.]|nr:hypothetical protein [Microvirga sp.]